MYIHESGIVAHTLIPPSNWETEAGIQTGLHSNFWDSLAYIVRPCLKTNQNKTKMILPPLDIILHYVLYTKGAKS